MFEIKITRIYIFSGIRKSMGKSMVVGVGVQLPFKFDIFVHMGS